MCLTQGNHSLNALRRLSVEKMATLHWFLRERLNRLGLSTQKLLELQPTRTKPLKRTMQS